MRVFDDDDPFDNGLSMLKVNDLSPAIQELVDNEIKRILQVSTGSKWTQPGFTVKQFKC